MAQPNYVDLKLSSPAGVEPMTYSWPLRTGSGQDVHDNGMDIMDTIRWVCDDVPEIKAAMNDEQTKDIDTGSYDAMKAICELFNNAIDKVAELVRTTFKSLY